MSRNTSERRAIANIYICDGFSRRLEVVDFNWKSPSSGIGNERVK